MNGFYQRSAIVVAIVSLSGCAPHSHSVDWYQHHSQERSQRLAYCKAQDIQDSDEDCRNAAIAETTIPKLDPKKDY